MNAKTASTTSVQTGSGPEKIESSPSRHSGRAQRDPESGQIKHPGRRPGYMFPLDSRLRGNDEKGWRLVWLPPPLAACLALAALLAPTAFATAPPHSATSVTGLPATLAIPAFKMHYRALRNGWHIGEATFTLERDGNSWRFHSRAQATGIASWFIHSTFSESSRFKIVNHRIRPIVYQYMDSGSPDHDETIRFDWGAGIARDREGEGKKPSGVSIAPGMLDRLSAQLAISRQLAAGAPLASPYRIVHDGAVSNYRLERKGNETITTPAGKFKTVLVVRRDPESGRENRFWLAPKYAWLPVKMQQIEPGDATYIFTLAHLQWLGAKARQQ